MKKQKPRNESARGPRLDGRARLSSLAYERSSRLTDGAGESCARRRTRCARCCHLLLGENMNWIDSWPLVLLFAFAIQLGRWIERRWWKRYQAKMASTLDIVDKAARDMEHAAKTPLPPIKFP